MKDFKNIADEIMSDINASKELKQKTLMRCMKKRQMPAIKFLVPAACFLFILGVINIPHILPLKAPTGEEGNPQINIMSGTVGGTETLAESAKGWFPATLDNAKKDFGSSFLTPSYTPEGFKLYKIHASGLDEHTAAKIVISYFAGEQSFLIMEEKTEMQLGLDNFKKIDINGITAYLKPDGSKDGKSADRLDTELHWFKEGIHYSVSGQITEDEAIKIAMSMK